MNTLVTLHISTSATVITVTAMLAGVLTPAIIAVVNHPIWSSEQKRLIALGCSIVVGILTVIGQGALTDFEVSIPTVITVVLAVVGASQAAYAVFWKPTGLADTIEGAVNPGPPVVPVVPAPEPEPVPAPTFDVDPPTSADPPPQDETLL